MITSSHHQSWLFFLPLAQQAALLKDDLLDAVDPLLDDPELIELVRQCLAARRPQSTRTGRPGIAPDRLLRSCVLKHLKGWSFRDLERELRSNLIYRRFTHYDAEATPDFTSFSRWFALLGPSVTQKIHLRVVEVARERGVAQGRKLKTDTTCVESNIHYPTDSSLLGDGIRVLSRSLARIATECKSGAVKVVNHARTVKYRLLEISRAAKSLTPVNQRRMKKSYKKLVALTRRAVREAGKVMKRWHKGKLPVAGSLFSGAMQPIAARFYPRCNNISPVLGGHRRWPLPTAVSFPLRTSARRRSWASSMWPCRRPTAYRASGRNTRSNAGSGVPCAGAPASNAP